jgi:hypothetical protein
LIRACMVILGNCPDATTPQWWGANHPFNHAYR